MLAGGASWCWRCELEPGECWREQEQEQEQEQDLENASASRSRSRRRRRSRCWSHELVSRAGALAWRTRAGAAIWLEDALEHGA